MNNLEKLYNQLALNTVLETERLILRPVKFEDIDDFLEFSADDETVFFMQRFKASNREEALTFLANGIMKAPLGIYAIVEKSSNKMIGITDLLIRDEYSAEIGYILNKNFQGKGFVTESSKKLVEIGFNHLKIEKIYARFDTKNPISGKVLTRLGMKQEGILRHVAKNPLGEWKDRAYFSILKDEYYQS